jgi:hypothetical protein
MYFWQIEKLKSLLVSRPLSEREVLHYAMWSSALVYLISSYPRTMNGIWDMAGAILGLVITVLGTIFIYRQNGGASGQHFLQRYVAIGWVVSIRWFVFVLVAAVLFGALLSMAGVSVTGQTTWQEFIFSAVMEVILFRNIGLHVRSVADILKDA